MPRRLVTFFLILIGVGSFLLLGHGAETLQGRPFVAAMPSVSVPPPLLSGIYTPGFVGESVVLEQQVQAVDAFSQPHSLVGIFMDLEADNPGYDIPVALNQLRENGYTGFLNLTSQRSAEAIASGEIDRQIARFAQAYRQWTDRTTNPMTFIAPLPEMNGAWETYGQTPPEFIAAYHHIQEIFERMGVPSSAVRWVFAPNGWSVPGHEFEVYYPGDRTVDVVAFSAYNWGYCHNAAWKEWQSPTVVFEPYVTRMKQMAPGKPLMISQTATTSMTQTGGNPTAKNEWLQQAYQYLANAGVRAVMYFNLDKECDWAVHSSHREPVAGYRQALDHPNIRYQSPDILSSMF